MDTFHTELYKICHEEMTPLKAVMLAMDITRVKHKDVWAVNEKRDAVKSCFIAYGTEQVLKNEQKHFDFAAALAVGIFR